MTVELHRRLAPRAAPVRLRFLCTGNFARSQIAAAPLQPAGCEAGELHLDHH